MSMFQICGRWVDDRPTRDGYHSSGIDVPTFSVDADSAGAAARIGHQMIHAGAVRGDKWVAPGSPTRTMLDVYQDNGDAGEVYLPTQTQWWAGDAAIDGDDVRRILRTFGADGYDISGRPLYAEQDADECTWWTPDGEVVLGLKVAPRGRWMIVQSDHLCLSGMDRRRRFERAHDALAHVMPRLETPGVLLLEVETWDV